MMKILFQKNILTLKLNSVIFMKTLPLSFETD
jgi:hypothetical protein